MISGELLKILIDNPGMKIEFRYSDTLNELMYKITVVYPKYRSCCGLITRYFYDDVVDCEIKKSIKKLKESLRTDIELGEK